MATRKKKPEFNTEGLNRFLEIMNESLPMIIQRVTELTAEQALEMKHARESDIDSPELRVERVQTALMRVKADRMEAEARVALSSAQIAEHKAREELAKRRMQQPYQPKPQGQGPKPVHHKGPQKPQGPRREMDRRPEQTNPGTLSAPIAETRAGERLQQLKQEMEPAGAAAS
jgi:hypothetical protein